MDPNTTSAIRDIFVMIAAGVFAVLCVVIILVFAKLYRPLRETAHNASRTSANLSRISGDLASISEETANNIAQTSRNAVSVSENLKEGSEELSGVVRTVGETAKSVSSAADNVSSIAETVSRFTTLGVTGGGTSGVGSMLRLLRNIFGGGRRSDDGGVQQGA